MSVVALSRDLQAQVYDKGNYVSVRLPFELYKGRKKAYGTVRVHFFNDGEALDSLNGELERRTHDSFRRMLSSLEERGMRLSSSKTFRMTLFKC